MVGPGLGILKKILSLFPRKNPFINHNGPHSQFLALQEVMEQFYELSELWDVL